MKKILTLTLCLGIFLSCKKESQEKSFDLKGTSWENSWNNTENVLWHGRLDFTSDHEVFFSNTFTKDKLMSSSGKAKLSYTIMEANSESPKIHITGKYNSVLGESDKGAIVDYILTYTPRVGVDEARLMNGNTEAYIKVVYK